MGEVPETFRYRWCEAIGGCACMGCVNVVGEPYQKRVCSNPLSYDEWQEWISENEQIELDGELFTKDEIREMVRFWKERWMW